MTQVTMRAWDAEQTAWVAARLDRPDVYWADFEALRVTPAEEVFLPPPANRFTTVGLAALTLLLLTGSPAWTVAAGGSAWTGVCIGSSTTGDAIGDTNLLGASKTYRRCDDGYPTRSNGLITYLTTMQTGEANHAWEEYGVIVPAAGASALTGAAVTAKPTNYTLLNRKSPAGLGTKTTGTKGLQIETLFT